MAAHETYLRVICEEFGNNEHWSEVDLESHHLLLSHDGPKYESQDAKYGETYDTQCSHTRINECTWCDNNTLA